MNIIFVTSTLTSGGSERVMSLLANRFAADGNTVAIVCLNKHIVFYDVNPFVTLMFAEDEVGSSLIRKMIWLRRFVQNNKPDVIVPFMEAVYCFTLFTLLGIKIPVVSSERIDPRKSPFARNVLRRVLLPLTTHLVVQTKDIKSFYPKFIQKKTSIIYNPVTDKVLNLPEVPKLKRIISVGKLDEQKNQHLLIRAFARIADAFPEWKLVIYGEGPLRNSLELLVKSLQLDGRVLLPGRCETVIEEMNRSKVFAFSSDYEGMSNAIMEAVCAGLPIVTTNVSGAAELVKDGEGGFVVPIRDEKKLAETLHKLLSDEKLREKMAKHNKATAPLFKLDRIVDQWDNLLHYVVASYNEC